jgi:aspartate dehydrogenase
MSGWRLGLIGIGAIGRDVLHHLSARHANARFTILRRSTGADDLPSNVDEVDSVEALIAAHPDLVIEAAGHHAIEASIPRILAAGIPVVAASVGCLVQETASGTLASDLQILAAGKHARLILPAGAIGGLDYVGTVAMLPELRITYTSRKPPEAWADELARLGIDGATLAGEHVLFEGSVAEAAALYPRNLNVAATLALAAGRMDAVSVRVVVDPAARGNTHEIDCRSSAGTARFEFVNAPAPANPKTSMVTALSLVHCVEEFFATEFRQDAA